jgi:hypothetical protein
MPQQDFRIFRALGLSFQIWFRNFVPFTLLTAVLYAPVFIWVATLDFESAGSLQDLVDRVFLWPIYAVTALATLLAPMLTYRVIQDLNGQRVSMMASIQHGMRGFIPAILVAVVVNLLQFIPFGGIAAAVITCIYFVAAPAAVAERLGPFTALARSATLTTGRRGGIFGLTFLIGIVFIVLLLAWIQPSLDDPGASFFADLRQNSLILVGALGILHMFTGIVEAVSYALLRQDKDGMSHEALARVFE